MSRYRNIVDSDYLSEAAHTVRWCKSIAFMADSSLAGCRVDGGLDLGDRTPLTGQMEELLGCRFVNSDVDLDVECLEGSYGSRCVLWRFLSISTIRFICFLRSAGCFRVRMRVCLFPCRSAVRQCFGAQTIFMRWGRLKLVPFSGGRGSGCREAPGFASVGRCFT